MDINYELYKVFFHVARTLSFSEAAGELFISQSAVSQSIKVLEKRLDGFGIEVPDGYAGFVFPRTSMAVRGLVCELPPVDSGYRGEIHAIISNVSNKPQELSKGTRIGQLVITPVVIADFVTDLGAKRGTGGFGSTGV